MDELKNEIAPTPDEVKDADMPASVAGAEPETPAPAEEPVAAPAEEPVAAPAPVEDENGVTTTHALLDKAIDDARNETREKTFRYIYDRYGVEDEAGLDDLVGNAQRYDSLSERYDADKKAWSEADASRGSELAGLKEQIALLQSGIDPSRYEDAKAIIKATGGEVTAEAIESALPTHPEWKKKEPQPISTISEMGNEPEAESAPGESEEDMMMKRYFKV